ncbi:helix-turn-helix transcriptional regulator [Pseudonocardia phyllosphaerae]|uniref:helix-turn-helix transcriptional regulator n=1 Tax=Pseudonocardia phyllosphaerae TaxID=3390502 RepID=UPI00397CB3C3
MSTTIVGGDARHWGMADAPRTELAAFLRTRRDRLTPADVGIPSTGRRRVAGLRREEVAQLAGVGLTWYTWLEQGRPIGVSEQVLTAIARALRLDAEERAHLLGLAGIDRPAHGAGVKVAPEHLELLERLSPYPATLQSSRYDVLAFNRAYRFLLDDLATIPPAERNCIRMLFTNPTWRSRHIDLPQTERRMVARLRQGYARHADQSEWTSFVAELRAASPRFAELWETGDVHGEYDAVKLIANPLVGELRLRLQSLWLDESLGSRIAWFVPDDAATRARLDELDRMVADARPLVERTPVLTA